MNKIKDKVTPLSSEPAARNQISSLFAKSHAFFIAVEDYDHVTSLQTPVRDVHLLAQVLQHEAHDYTIHPFVLNPGKAELEIFLTQTFPALIGPDDRVLLYFAGHGIALNEENIAEPKGYLLPRDAQRNDESTFLPMKFLNQQLQHLPCRHLLLLLDCCFAGSFQWANTGTRSGSLDFLPKCIYRQRFEYFVQEPAWQVITSAAYNQQALDVASDYALGKREKENALNSPFALALAEALRDGAGDLVPPDGDGLMTLSEIFSYLQNRLSQLQSTHLQKPAYFPLPRHRQGEYVFLNPLKRLFLTDYQEGNNPYRGLKSYEPENHNNFYGRDRVIKELCDRLAHASFLVVSGASGSGKSSLANPVKTYEGVTSWQVNDILFDGCTFNNLERGIVMGNATTNVIACTFDKNKFAVEMGMVAPTADAKTYIGGDGAKNTFKYCDWGVYAKSYGYVLIKNNHFEDCPVGVILEGSSIYRIEENTFKNSNVVGNPVFSTGIGLIQSGEASANDIVCNQYISTGAGSGPNPPALIREGISVAGGNKGTYFDKNKFDCWYDVRLSQLTWGNTLANGELPNQGADGNPVYNQYTIFSPGEHKVEIFTPSPDLGLTNIFKYYHPSGTCNVSQIIPRKPLLGTCFVPPTPSNPNPTYYNFENSNTGVSGSAMCSFGPIEGIVKPGDCRTKACLDDYYTRITQKDNLLKPGDAPALYANVQSAPNATASLSALNAASPYLSERLLAAVLNSAMSSSNKTNVLAANGRLSSYIKALAAQNLTTVQYNSLNGSASQASLRDDAIGKRIELNNKKMALLRHLTDSLFRIGNITAADNLLAADPEQFSKEARVGLKLQTANYTGASQLISAYATTSQADVDFKFIQTLNLQRIVAGTKPSAVDSTALLAIALGYSPQSGYAKTLVGILYGRSFEPVLPPLPPGFQGESSEDRGVVSTASLTGFTLFPNPANDALTVNIIGTVEPETDEIMIFSVQGKLLLHQSVTSTTSVLDISQLQAGFYILSWIKTGHVQTSRYFVKTKI